MNTYPIYRYAESSAPPLCLGIGNGFPPQVYAPLAQALRPHYEALCFLPRPWWEGADPQAFSGWENLAEDFMAALEQQALAPALAVGHSMSGVALVMAAAQRPDLFRALVLLDPVFFPPWALRLGQMTAFFGLRLNQRLVDRALQRQRHWPSYEAAYARFRGRSLFERCSDELVHLYTQGMTRPAPDGGLELAHPPEWEARIFATPPFAEWRYLARLCVPTLVLYGAQSAVFVARMAARWRRVRPDIGLQSIANSGHLLPMEQPQAVAEAIVRFFMPYSGAEG
jgi:pimeloyl-ACP methyl ester carboxylesterase